MPGLYMRSNTLVKVFFCGLVIVATCTPYASAEMFLRTATIENLDNFDICNAPLQPTEQHAVTSNVTTNSPRKDRNAPQSLGAVLQ